MPRRSLPFSFAAATRRLAKGGLGLGLGLGLSLSLGLGLALVFGAAAARADALRVCADPNNLPYSDRSESGFENALAELAARALGFDGVAYTWRPQRRGFVRDTLDARLCDVIIGVPVGYERALTTRPYYYSTYVFVTRTRDGAAPASFDDPALRRLRIGVPAVGDDYSSTPGETALERRGIVDNVVGYSIYGNYAEPHPPSRIIEAVAAGDIDVAVAWGPVAGYFAARQSVPLSVAPVSADSKSPSIPFVYGMAMAVRRGDVALHDRLDDFISAQADDIERLLARFSVPLVEPSRAQRILAASRAASRRAAFDALAPPSPTTPDSRSPSDEENGS